MSTRGKKQKVVHDDSNEIYLVASGDLRLSANQQCWPAQRDMEKAITIAFTNQGYKIVRGHAYDEKLQHGFIFNQRMGMDVFKKIPPNARVIVAEAVWQYSHHVLAGLRDHKGPILTIGNWNPQWPGLVGLLNLNASLTKMNKFFSSLWSQDFTDEFFLKGITQWLKDGKITHDVSHVKDLKLSGLDKNDLNLGRKLAQDLKTDKAIMGIFDEGCMGMYNAIIDDEYLQPCGIFKERLSQSALVAAMREVTDHEATAVRDWLKNAGCKFVLGTNSATELTANQILEQCKMYIAAGRIAFEFSCDIIGIQYQQGLKDMTAASDLAEGMLNNVDRPPIFHKDTGEELFKGKPIVHFNEVDEGAAVDALVTNRVWTALGLDPATTLHDVRYGEHYQGPNIDDFIWLLEISGSAPPSHFVGGWKGASSERQPPMYFPLGGGTLKGVSKPGEIVWSRVFIMDNKLHADIGRGTVVELPHEELEKRWRATTYQWPIMNAIFHGVGRDKLMARHKANHCQVAYGNDAPSANKALQVKAAMFTEMGIKVHICGDVKF